MNKENYFKKFRNFTRTQKLLYKTELFLQNKTPAKQHKINFSKIFNKM